MTFRPVWCIRTILKVKVREQREGLEEVTYPSEEVKHILEKTLGVPLFQEHAMRIAIVAAGFAPAEASNSCHARWRRPAERPN